MPTDDNIPPEKSNLKVVSFRKEQKIPKNKTIHITVVKQMIEGNFPTKFHRWVDTEGHSQIYEEVGNGIVRLVADDYVHHQIAMQWLSHGKILWGVPAADDCVKIRKLWLAMSKPVSERWVPLTFANDSRLALHKVDFSPGPKVDLPPRYADLMSRMTDKEIFMAWVGSLLDPSSQRQQYAWIYGSGGNGKSAMIRAIMNVLGPVATNENPPTKDAKHWTIGLRNKRLVVFADCNNTGFITSGEFKSLTGEDGIRMEPKGKPSYTEHIHAKFLISSNDKPTISSNKADQRRCLFFHIGEIDHDFGCDYEERLQEETTDFLIHCWNVYKELSGDNRRFMFKCLDNKQMESITDMSELDMDIFCTEWINVIEPDPSDLKKQNPYVSRMVMKQLMEKAGFRTRYEQKKLMEFMERRYNIRIVAIKIGLCTIRVWANCQVALSLSGKFPQN